MAAILAVVIGLLASFALVRGQFRGRNVLRGLCDIYESVAGYLNSDLSTEPGVSETITGLTGEGKLGIKTGGGLFEYSQDELAELPAKRAAALVAVRKTLDDQDV